MNQATTDIRALLNKVHSDIMGRTKPATKFQKFILETSIPYLRQAAIHINDMPEEKRVELKDKLEKGRSSRSPYWKEVCNAFVTFMDHPHNKSTVGYMDKKPDRADSTIDRDADLVRLKEAYATVKYSTDAFLKEHHPDATQEQCDKFIAQLRA